MRRWQTVQQGLKSLFLVALILASCAAPGGNEEGGCGGTEAFVTCVDVVSITPTSGATNTSNVDARRNVCTDLMGMPTGIEPFGDHNAQVTLINQRFPTARGDFAVRIVGFSVTYRLNGPCPTAARGCPPLPGFSSSESIFIPSGGTVTVTLPFVPINVKAEYVAGGGELTRTAPSYTATYTFTAQTVRFTDTFTVQGNSQFTIADFNNCP